VAARADQAQPERGQAAVEMLKAFLQLDTTNPPGDTNELTRQLQTRFNQAGIANEIIVAPNGKAAHFIARLPGDGSKRPVLLAAHTDVVPVERARWSVDPFGAGEKDGFIYGRGALDNKSAVAAFAQAVLDLKRSGVRLARDVIFLAEADEEQGQFNTGWLAREHWSKIDAEFVINEGGSTLWNDDHKVTSMTVSYADKLTVNLKLTATGVSGHSSRPLPVDQTANGQLIAALARLTSYETAIQLSDATRAYLQSLAKQRKGNFAFAVDELLVETDSKRKLQAARRLVQLDDTAWGLEGLLKNTFVVTMLDAGVKPNVIPGSAEAVLNARLLPGNTVDDFIAELTRVIDNSRIKIEIVSGRSEPDVAAYYRARSQLRPSPIDTELFGAIEQAATQVWPGITVMPTLLVASTDATPWRERGVPVYGIGPFPVDKVSLRRVHGDDERVEVRAVREGADFVYRMLVTAAKK
jgi:acetylornithine deacetylase/succinyl-diaminopimelate desuccinylase-like protein